MLGVALLVVAFLVGIPVMLMSLGAVAGLLGTFLTADAEDRFEGSELLKLSQ